uniref:28S ribosomal protein S18b, mitochondrial n=1 Tax=Plectus sambesii TaxID=2011161 RepID=A0A914X7Y2_9BILA
MSFVRLGVSHLLSTTPVRLSCFRASLHTSCRPKQKAVEQNNPEEGDANAQPAGDEIPEGDMLAFNHVIKKKGLFKPQHSIDTQIKYMNSKAFYDAYGGLSIFMWYKRNYKGQYLFQPKPRLYCITKENKFNTNNPCPVCRDEYLFFHYKNPALIEQFLYEGTDKPRPLLRTGLCREQYVLLQAALLKAKEMGSYL